MFSEHFSFDHDVDNLQDFQKKRPVVFLFMCLIYGNCREMTVCLFDHKVSLSY